MSHVRQQLEDWESDSEQSEQWKPIIDRLKQASGPLPYIQTILEQLKAKLKVNQSLKATLKWPCTEKEVRKLIEALKGGKVLLSLALEVDSITLLNKIQEQSSENARYLSDVAALLQSESQVNLDRHTELTQGLSNLRITQTSVKNSVDDFRSQFDTQNIIEEREKIAQWLSRQDYSPERHGATSIRQ